MLSTFKEYSHNYYIIMYSLLLSWVLLTRCHIYLVCVLGVLTIYDMDMACLYFPLWNNNSLTIAPTCNFLALDDMLVTFNMLLAFGNECFSNMDIR